tara:strand:+ start:455 stop:580 length:126 start_codon:yes stop_codon:yes gene_type:complete
MKNSREKFNQLDKNFFENIVIYKRIKYVVLENQCILNEKKF